MEGPATALIDKAPEERNEKMWEMGIFLGHFVAIAPDPTDAEPGVIRGELMKLIGRILEESAG